MRKIISIIENLNRQDIKLFHGTSQSEETIRRRGLIPGRHNAVFLTDNPQLAIDYAESDQERTGLDNITVVSVMVSKLNVDFLTGDVDHTDEQDWQASLRETDQCMYGREIPPEFLTFIETETF